MATSQEKQSGTVIQAWLPHPLDQELRKQAEAERPVAEFHDPARDRGQAASRRGAPARSTAFQ